jgi:hypothetical protein
MTPACRTFILNRSTGYSNKACVANPLIREFANP